MPKLIPVVLAFSFSTLPAMAADFSAGLQDGHYDPRLEGVWQSQGYGEVAVFSGGALHLYHRAGELCLADQRPPEDIADPFRQWRMEGRQIIFSASPISTQYRFDRLNALPQACQSLHPLSADQRYRFVIDTLSAWYPSFERRKIDWPTYAATATHFATDDDAWQALDTLFTALDDPHSELRRGDVTIAAGEAPTLQRLTDSGGLSEKTWLAAWRDGVLTSILQGNGHLDANRRIFWGRVGDIGYLNIVTMGAYGDDDQATLAAVLDQALSEFQGAKAVVLDISNNRGGFDDISRAIAERFCTQRALAFTKQPAGSPQTPPQAFWLEPTPRPHYSGPVYLVTSDITVSAAEVLTLYLRSQPKVIQVGKTTRGALSDQLEKPLGDDWSFSLSAEIYRDAKGNWPEGSGLAPDVDLDIYGGADPLTSHAKAMTGLFERIRNHDPLLVRGGR